MPSAYPTQRNRIVEINQSPSIVDVDRVRIVQINDEPQPFQQIILEPDLVNIDASFKTLSARHQTTALLSHSQKLNQISLMQINYHTSQNNQQQRWREKHKTMQEFKHKIFRMISHFAYINSTSLKNRVSSEKVYNIIQQRKSIHEKQDQQFSVTKYLFEMEYTNDLSLLKYVIIEKQKRYDIYEESEELDKILQLIENQIDLMTELYLNHEQDKMHLIYSQDLHQAIHHLKAKITPPSKIQTIIQNHPQQQNHLELIREQIIVEQSSNQSDSPKPNEPIENTPNNFQNQNQSNNLTFNGRASQTKEENGNDKKTKQFQQEEEDSFSQVFSSTEQKELFKLHENAKKDISKIIEEQANDQNTPNKE